ncbi:PorT family protein [Flavobacterium sp. 17A]|uniref:PorT family protein n=1 Tax=Flavobacterium potami TaxID=2872310 RepID=A0A9X1H5K6_9FLAO|nr:porin family protein [Flavobacterium potami]MBZ4033479.1 PorT family protein [Flavobacterium potami]
MKKITVLLFTISLISFKTTAQESKIKFGLQGGANYSTLWGFDSYADLNSGLAYVFGVSFQYKIQDNLSIKTDLNYERKTQKSKNNIEILDPESSISPGTYSVKSTVYLNYLVLPVLLKYNFSKDKSFYVNAGPYLGYLLKSGIKTHVNIPGETDYDEEDTKYKKSMDFGFTAGIGKEFKVNENHQVYVEIRDNLGVSDISKTEVMNGGAIKTNSLNVLVGYTFN